MGAGVHSRGKSRRGVMLTTDLRLVPKLRMSGAVPHLHQYAFMAWVKLLNFNLNILRLEDCKQKRPDEREKLMGELRDTLRSLRALWRFFIQSS
jgi:hypothetical protein